MSDKFKITTLQVGMLGTNCYLVYLVPEATLCVIDPGGDAELIAECAANYPYRRLVFLLTHAHVDHISGLGELVKKLHPEAVYLNPEDETMYRSPTNALEPYLPAARNLPETTGSVAVPGMEILALPGHSRGGAGFYFPAEAVLFSGDSIFAGSVGRTDFTGGDWPTLEKSLKEKVLTLPDDVTIYPGHGPATSVRQERLGNPYLN